MMVELKPGDRIELVEMLNDPYPIIPGTRGTVTSIRHFDDWSQVSVKWDNGRSLMLVLPGDKFKVVSQENAA